MAIDCDRISSKIAFIRERSFNEMPPLPIFTKPFFWDIHFESLDTKADCFFIIERLLEHSDDRSFFWLLNNYSDQQLLEVIKNSRSLSRKTGYFWKSYFSLKEGELKCLQPLSHRAGARSWND